jgi:O-acetyl-ADP-ribose deacetylase (regulator of RNase III)
MNVWHGDLVDYLSMGKADVFLHNCNCFNVMGYGVARVVRDHYPEAYEADQETERGDPNKLGTFSHARVIRGGVSFDLFNLYGQYRYGPRREQNLDYAALEKALHAVNRELEIMYGDQTLRIAFPLLGTGMAGGRWNKVAPLITEAFPTHHLTLIKQ